MSQRPGSVDRRAFLRGVGAAGVALSLPELLAACGTKGSKQTAKSCVSKDISATDKNLNFSNWPEYIDVSDNGKRMPSLEKFMRQTGIKVAYNTDINDNDEFFAKVQNQLGDCQPIGRDIITMTDWMAGRMIDLGWIQKLDADKIPNVHDNLISNSKIRWNVEASNLDGSGNVARDNCLVASNQAQGGYYAQDGGVMSSGESGDGLSTFDNTVAATHVAGATSLELAADLACSSAPTAPVILLKAAAEQVRTGAPVVLMRRARRPASRPVPATATVRSG